MAFDVIIQNPPFNGNPNAERFTKGTKGRKVPKSIWAKFMMKAFDSCEHLLFLGPDKWRGDLDFYITFDKNGKNNNRGNKGECWKIKEKLLGNRGLVFIKFLGNTIWPDVKANVDYFYWEKKWDGFTEISCLDGEITKDLKSYWEAGNWILPSRDIWHTHSDFFNKLFDWNNENKILLRKAMSGLAQVDKQASLGEYKWASGTGWNKEKNKFSVKQQRHIHQYCPKVLISMIRKPRARYIKDCGIGDNMHYCLVSGSNEGYRIQDIIESDDFQKAYQLFAVECGEAARPPFWLYKYLRLNLCV